MSAIVIEKFCGIPVRTREAGPKDRIEIRGITGNRVNVRGDKIGAEVVQHKLNRVYRVISGVATYERVGEQELRPGESGVFKYGPFQRVKVSVK